MKKLFLGFAACAMLCACTSDDLASLGESAGSVFDGDMVYMTVNIKDVGSSTRATSGGYKNGTTEEHAISSANFYFYDSNGELIASGEAVSESGQTGTDGTNVEYESETVVAVSGLTEYPDYMVTVINAPKDFTPGNSLTELAAVLTDADGIQASGTNFIMSTSSYEDSSDDRTGNLSFVTKVDESYFREEPVRLESDYSEANPAVDVFVERLAAKVVVGLDDEITDGDGNALEKSTIGGYPAYNVPVGAVIGLDDDSEVEIALLGWKLNGTSRESYMMKSISDGWTESDPWNGWNSAGENRSFWGMSPNYGQTDGGPGELYYPDSAVKDSTVSYIGNTDADEADASARLNKYLKYSSLKNANSFNGAEYCAENTNTTSVLDDESSTGITSALVLAQAYASNTDGEAVPTDLIKWRGSLYTVDKWKDIIAADASEMIMTKTASEMAEKLYDTFASILKFVGCSLEDLLALAESADHALYVNTERNNVTSVDDLILFDGSFLNLVNHGDGYVGVRANAKTATGYHAKNSQGLLGSEYADPYQPATSYHDRDVTPGQVRIADEYQKEGSYTWTEGDDNSMVKVDGWKPAHAATNSLDGENGRNGMYLKFDPTNVKQIVISGLKMMGDILIECDGYDLLYLDPSVVVQSNYDEDTMGATGVSYYDLAEFCVWAIEGECQKINDYIEGHKMKPNLYKDGLMYYASPIQHLNPSEEFAEGSYGVVRNHWYDMSISSISQIGKGIADEDEVIVPQKEVLYYLGADINILSWKTVSQKMTF